MRKGFFGRTGLEISELALGGGVTGGILINADEATRYKALQRAEASGLTVAGDTKACLEVINSGRFDAAQVYYNAINPSAAWSRVPPAWKGQDFSGVIAACFRQNMGVLNIRVWGGGPLASPKPPE